MSVKISIIGAGSATFSLGLLKDICMTPNLQDSTISFMDISEERLNNVYDMCKRYAKEAGIKLKIEKTTDRKKSMKDADFVINTALDGGHKSYVDGWEVAMKLGYKFGGSMHILHDEAFWVNYHQFKLMEEILVDMLEVAPNAWYMLVANPVMAGVTYLRRKYKNAKVVGFCHGYAGVYQLAKTLGLDRENITFEIPGVNHFVWLNKFYYKGENAFPLLDKWIEKFEKDPDSIEGPKLSKKRIDLYKRFGVFPIGDTAGNGGGAWGSWYHSDQEAEEKWGEDPKGWFYDLVNIRSVKRIAEIDNAIKDKSIKLMEKFPPAQSNEGMIPFIESIAFDIPRVLIVNILNDNNYISGIPLDYEVEIPALVSAKGVQGIKTNDLPKTVISYALRDYVAPTEMEIEAFIKGDKNMLVSLIMMDPWNKSEEQARQLLEEIMDIPFNKEMRKHYR